MAAMTAIEPSDPEFSPPEGSDAQRLHELGYKQELRRGMRIFDNVAMGFAPISPVVGLYAVAFVGFAVAGAAWVWVLPVVLVGQCLLLAVYSELASEFPVANGAYQWSRRLVGAPTPGSTAGSRCAVRGGRTRRSPTRRALGAGAARDRADAAR